MAGIPAPCPARHAGISLVELVMVCAALAIVLATAAPDLQALRQRQALVAAGNSLASGLHATRSAAVTRGQPARLCASVDGSVCAAAAAWSSGWRSYLDSEPATTLAHGSLPAGVIVSSSAGRLQVRYLPDGRSAGSNTTFTLCSGGRHWRQVVVNNAGRVRQTAVSDTPCPP